jgi:hypothetical protein
MCSSVRLFTFALVIALEAELEMEQRLHKGPPGLLPKNNTRELVTPNSINKRQLYLTGFDNPRLKIGYLFLLS